MNKKGFSLIELLAIIVILAIIAVITVPIILNIIESSNMGTASNSAYGFKDAVEKYYALELYKNRDLKINGSYDVLNGVLTGDSLPEEGIVIPADGKIPSSGYLEYKDNKLKSGCLTIDDYKVVFSDGKVENTEKGVCSKMLALVLNLDLTDVTYTEHGDGYKYLDVEYPVYFNPVTNSVCDSSDAVSTNGTTAGCMKWYAYSFKDNILNMILDHNLNSVGSGVVWATEADYNNSLELGSKLGVTNIKNSGYGPSHDNGPLTALDYLMTATSSWNTEVLGSYSQYRANIPTANYVIDYTIDNDNDGVKDYKARMMTAQEVAYISRFDTFDETQQASNSTIQVVASFLYSNRHEGRGQYAYWLVSPVYGNSNRAWNVYGYALNYNYYLLNVDLYGVRPVISVPANIILDS